MQQSRALQRVFGNKDTELLNVNGLIEHYIERKIDSVK